MEAISRDNLDLILSMLEEEELMDIIYEKEIEETNQEVRTLFIINKKYYIFFSHNKTLLINEYMPCLFTAASSPYIVNNVNTTRTI